MTIRRLTAAALGLSAFLLAYAMPGAVDANAWRRAHYYGVTNRSPDDVWADLCDGYNSCWAQHKYRQWFGYDHFVYRRGCSGQCGCAPLHYREFAPGVLTGSREYHGSSWYRVPGTAPEQPAP